MADHFLAGGAAVDDEDEAVEVEMESSQSPGQSVLCSRKRALVARRRRGRRRCRGVYTRVAVAHYSRWACHVCCFVLPPSCSQDEETEKEVEESLRPVFLHEWRNRSTELISL